MYLGAEHFIGFLTVVPSAQWYSYLGRGEGRRGRWGGVSGRMGGEGRWGEWREGRRGEPG